MGGSCSALFGSPFDRDNEFDLTSSERKDLYNKNKPKYKVMRRGVKGYESLHKNDNKQEYEPGTPSTDPSIDPNEVGKNPIEFTHPDMFAYKTLSITNEINDDK
eukprot:193829_1